MEQGIPSVVHPMISSFLDLKRELLFDLVDAFGSPLHILFPEIFQNNVQEYIQVFQNHTIDNYSVLFAMKSNKADAFLEVSALEGIGIDVSSVYELRTAMGRGIKEISVSGPSKTDDFLALAIKNGCIVNIDNINELHQIIRFYKNFPKLNLPRAKILLRVNPFEDKFSRFGIPFGKLNSCYTILHDNRQHAKFLGLSFHLSGYSINERVRALKILFHEVIYTLPNFGLKISIIDIGGGFTINYTDEKHWNYFVKNVVQNTSINGDLLASPYPYYTECPKEKFLAAILSSLTDEGIEMGSLIKKLKIELLIEPGRSLLDQAGITCMSVKGLKEITGGKIMLDVDANINHLSEQWFSSDFLPQPVLLSKSRPGTSNISTDASTFTGIGGNTCLEVDLLAKRKVGFESAPQKGDLLIFINTAAYQMDSNESSFHLIPIPSKICAFRDSGNVWKWKKDSEFSFVDIAN